MQFITVAVFAALVAVAAASTAADGCPHPDEAKHILFEEVVVSPAHPDTRHVEHLEVSKEIMGNKGLSCITVVSRVHGATPDFISFGKNKEGGYSFNLHSRIRTPMNATVYIYST